jgi:branched-chain amino acid transport system ATP-binding protein
MSQPLLHVRSLEVRYGAVQAVDGIEFEVEQGEVVALLGANGAGKSSTLNALAGLVPAFSGAVTFDGVDITNIRPEMLVDRGMTLSPEGRRVFGSLSVEENLRMGAFGLSDPALIKSAWERVYSLFPILFERRAQFAGTLSGGQQQMLAVGRALMSHPKMLLLDEPSLGLAPKIIEQIFELFQTLNKQGVTILVVEQNVSMALEVADRAYVLANGEIATSGTATSLAASTNLQDAYLGGA